MAFWKKSEDPWDIDPEKRRQPTVMETPEDEQASPGLLEQAKGWNEARKRARQESAPPPIPCPWCGGEMGSGYLMGCRGIWWAPGCPGALAKWVSVAAVQGAFRVDTEGGLLTPYRTAWYCPDCQKLVLDVPEDSAESAEGTFEEHVREYQARQENSKENDR